MKNRKGISTVLVCVIVLIISMLLAVIIEYGAIYNCAESEKNEAQLRLDSLVTSYAVEKYDGLKQGKAYDDYLNREELIRKAYEALDFSNASINEIAITKVSMKYSIQRPTITYLSGGQFGIETSFDVIVPFEMFGHRVADIRIPILIVSKYTER